MNINSQQIVLKYLLSSADVKCHWTDKTLKKCKKRSKFAIILRR